jgi:hypothetical protein
VVRVHSGPPTSRERVAEPFEGFGAIAQLGERVLCKHEVVGSIPSGSTKSLERGLADEAGGQDIWVERTVLRPLGVISGGSPVRLSS